MTASLPSARPLRKYKRSVDVVVVVLLPLLMAWLLCSGSDDVRTHSNNNNNDGDNDAIAAATTIASARHVAYAKELGVYTPWPSTIADAMGCDVCEHLIVNAYLQLAERAASVRPRRVREDDALDVLEHVCVPYAEGGEWLRRVAVHVRRVNTTTQQQQQRGAGAGHDTTMDDATSSAAADDDDVGNTHYRFATRVLDTFTACKRTCATLAQLCERVLDSAAADALSHELLKAVTARSATTAARSRSSDDDDDDADDDEQRVAAIVRRVCGVTAACRRRRALRAAAARALVDNDTSSSSSQRVRVDELVADTAQPTSSQEREVERLMHTMKVTQGRSTQVLSRAEMRALQQAVLRGDRDAVAAIDPSLAQLTDEAFDEIRRLTEREGWYASSSSSAADDDDDADDDATRDDDDDDDVNDDL